MTLTERAQSVAAFGNENAASRIEAEALKHLTEVSEELKAASDMCHASIQLLREGPSYGVYADLGAAVTEYCAVRKEVQGSRGIYFPPPNLRGFPALRCSHGDGKCGLETDARIRLDAVYDFAERVQARATEMGNVTKCCDCGDVAAALDAEARAWHEDAWQKEEATK